MSKHEACEAVSAPTNSVANDKRDENDADQMETAQPVARPGCIKAGDQLSYRVMDNCPGPGWYWELFRGQKIVARGLADTRHEAVAQLAVVMHAQTAAPVERNE